MEVTEREDSSLEHSIELGMLLDFYGELLSDKQREAMNLYYNEDLSLAEIASLTSLTRPGVRDRIVKAAQLLRGMEDKLGLAARFLALRHDVSSLIADLEACQKNGNADRAQLGELLEKARRLTEEL